MGGSRRKGDLYEAARIERVLDSVSSELEQRQRYRQFTGGDLRLTLARLEQLDEDMRRAHVNTQSRIDRLQFLKEGCLRLMYRTPASETITSSDAVIEKATRSLARPARLLPSRRRAMVLQTQRDLFLAQKSTRDVARRQRKELEDLLADAVRSRLGQSPGVSTKVAWAWALLVVMGTVVGLDVAVHLDVAVRFVAQTIPIPFISFALGVAMGVLQRRRKVG